MMNKLLPTHKSKLDKALVDEFKDSLFSLDEKLITNLAFKADEKLLAILAFMYDVDISGLSSDKARELIVNAFKIHKYSGTRYALEKALKAFYNDSEILEWFNSGGEAYTFDVVLNSTDTPINANTQNKAIEIINRYKNVRSHLRKTAVNLKSSAQFYIGFAPKLAVQVAIYPYAPDIKANANLDLGAGTYIKERINNELL